MAHFMRQRRRTRMGNDRSCADAARSRRRHLLVESLEPRRLLAADIFPCAASPWMLEDSAEGEGEDTQVLFRLGTSDLDGNSISEVANGEQFFLDVTVQDVRPSAANPGVFAAYLDVLYDSGIVAVVESQSNSMGFDIEFGPKYPNGGIADASTLGLIDEAGAFQSGFNPLGPGQFLLFRIRFEAGGFTAVDDTFESIDEDSRDVVLDVLANDSGRSGVALFSGDPADQSPGRDVVFNDPPTEVPDEATDFVDTSIRVLDAGSPTIAQVDAPTQGGSVRISADGTHLLYTPRPEFSGQEAFAYQLTNGQWALVTVVVDPVNDPPVAVDDSYQVELNELLDVPSMQGVLGNDSDEERDALTAVLVEPPDHGNVTLFADGSFEYTPETGYSGWDQFRYVARDGSSSSNVATASIEVDPPHVGFRLEATDTDGNVLSSLDGGDLFHVRAYVQDLRENTLTGIVAAYLDLLYSADQVAVVDDAANPLGIDLEFFSGYDEGMSADALVDGILDNVGATQGTEQPTGGDELLLFQVAMRAKLGELEDDSFQNIDEDSRDVVLDVLGNDRAHSGTAFFNGQPSASSPDHDVTYFVPREKVADHKIVFTDTSLDIDATGLVITDVGSTSHGGVVEIAADGLTLTYTPAADFFGFETFTYTVGDLLTAQATVEVTPVNDPPQAETDIYHVRENLELVVDNVLGVLANDQDVDGDTLNATLSEPPVHGDITFNSDGSFVYTPPRNFSGPDQFSYVAHDGTFSSDPVMVTLEFDPPPVAIRLELTDADGNVVAEIVDGQRLYVQAWVQDLRDASHPQRGLEAAYLDLIYDQASFRPILDSQLPLGFEIEMGDEFASPGAGNADLAGVIDEVGSSQSGGVPLGGDEILLFTMPFDVSGPQAADDGYTVNTGSSNNPFEVILNDLQLKWSADFTPDAADDSPGSDVLLFDSSDPVEELDVRFTGNSTIVRNEDAIFISHVDLPDQGGEAEISTDGLQILYTPAVGYSGIETFHYTVSNSSGRVGDALVTVTVVPGWQNLRDPLDVNDDGVIVPLDALLVINDLNANGIES